MGERTSDEVYTCNADRQAIPDRIEIPGGRRMDKRKTDAIASELDDLIVDVEELREEADGTSRRPLEETQTALERAREALDDAGDSEQ
jgi:hypothetical protein